MAEKDEKPVFLKELVKILAAINDRNKYLEYLRKTQGFEADSMLNKVKAVLEVKKNHLQDSLFQNKQEDAMKLQELIAVCKFYSEVEHYGKWNDIGFKVLQR